MEILKEAAAFCAAYTFTWPINYQLQSNHFCCAAALQCTLTLDCHLTPASLPVQVIHMLHNGYPLTHDAHK